MSSKNKPTLSEEQLLGIETHLRSRMQPIDPDPEFVNHLRHRLTTDPDTVLEGPFIRRETLSLVLVSFLMVALGVSALAAIFRLSNLLRRK